MNSLMYFMLKTRSNITFSISQISRFSSNSTFAHWTIVQRIFKYLKQYFTLKLIYQKENLLNYTNANWARDNDKKSIEKYLYKLEKATINWSFKRQTTIALFNCEAKYMITFKTTKEALWMRRLLNEFY